MSPPQLSGLVVHWGDRDPLDDLLAVWPRDPRFELVVVDNADTPGLELPAGCAGTVLRPEANLGFAGGVNAAARAARAEILLLLNSDVAPEPGALEALVRGFEELRDDPRSAGLAPRLIGPVKEGTGGDRDESQWRESQWRWQLRDLPSPAALLLHALFLPVGGKLTREPAAGEPVAQPAAAALALTRKAFDAVGGLDDGFHPAWFEDVDLARRLHEAGLVLRYYPQAQLFHRLGSSVASLGYGPFLWIYSKNLVRYLDTHHGRLWATAARWLLPLGALARLLALPLRRPRRAASRRDAARGLVAAARGAVSGWKRPTSWAERFARPRDPS